MKLRLRSPVFLTLLFLGFTTSISAAPDIQLLGPFGGDVRSLAIHPLRPNQVFVGTADGQIFFSLDSGDHWTRLEPGLSRRDLVVDNFAFHPTDPDLIYAASWELRRNHGWLARSGDGGATWETLPTGHIKSQIRAIAIAPSQPNVIALGVSEGVLLTRDAGRSWSNIALGYQGLQNVESLAFDPEDEKTLYAGTWRLGWKTTDQGKRWTAIHEGMHFDSDMFSLVVNPRQTSVLYASACTGIYKSVNGGRNWSKLRAGIPKDANRTRTLHLDPSEPDTIYAGTTEGLFVSHDAGAAWKNLIPSVVVNAISVSPANPLLVLVGTDDAGVLKSEDGGRSFRPSNEGFIHRQVGALAISANNPNYVLAGLAQDGLHGGLFVSQDGGVTWLAHNEGLGEGTASIRKILLSPDSEAAFVATGNGVYSGIPLQTPWRVVPGTAELAVNDVVLSGSGHREMLLAARQGVFQIDLATGQRRRFELGDEVTPAFSLLLDGAAGQMLAATASGLYRVVDSGRAVPAGDGLPPGPVNFIKRNGNRLLAGTRQGIYSSDDAAKTWIRPPSIFPLDIVDLGVDPRDPKYLVATDSTGGYLFESRDGGDTWKAFPPENRSRITRLRFTETGRLLAATLSEGVYLVQMPARLGD